MKHLYFGLFLITICFYSIAQNAPLKIRLELDENKNKLHIFFVNATDSISYVNLCFDHQTYGELKPNIDISFKRKGSDKYWTPIASEYIPNKNNCFQKIEPRSEIEYPIHLDLSFRENISMNDYSEIKVDVITEVIVGYNIYHNYILSNSLGLGKRDSSQVVHYDFKNFVNYFPDLKLPFRSNGLYRLSVGNSIEKNTVNYFIFFNQKNSQTPESPKIRKNSLLMEYSDNLGFVEDGEFYPVARLYLNSSFISLIAKIFQGEYGYYELFNFNRQGKCLSAILLSKYSSGSSHKDSTAFIYNINFEIQRDGLIYLNEDYFSERDMYQTIQLTGDGYFEIIHEYIRYPKEPLEICNQNSPLYDPNSCAQTICDQLHPNYNPHACALSQMDPSSPNYDPSLFIALFYHLSLPFLR